MLSVGGQVVKQCIKYLWATTIIKYYLHFLFTTSYFVLLIMLPSLPLPPQTMPLNPKLRKDKCYVMNEKGRQHMSFPQVGCLNDATHFFTLSNHFHHTGEVSWDNEYSKHLLSFNGTLLHIRKKVSVQFFLFFNKAIFNL